MKNNRHVPLIMGLLAIAIAIYLAIWIGGALGVLGAALLLAFGVSSIKTALFASDKEIQELTDPDLTRKPSETTIKNLEDRT